MEVSPVIVSPVSPIPGNNTPGQPDTLAALKARVTAEEVKNPPDTRTVVPEVTAPSPVQVQAPVTPPEAKATEGNKTDSLQQFRDKDGNVSLDKIEKANEHLRMSTEERQAFLLKQNKELQKKFTQVSQELKQGQNKVQEQAPPVGAVDFSQLTPETRQQLMAELEKDPVGAIFRVAQAAAMQQRDIGVSQVRAEIEPIRSSFQEKHQASQLDELANNGHTWILTEGLGRFEKVFQENPELLRAKNPYRAALGYMDDIPANRTAPASAQGGLPTLIGGHAVPPPSSVPPPSPEQEMQKLSEKLRLALAHHDKAGAKQIAAQMDKLERGY